MLGITSLFFTLLFLCIINVSILFIKHLYRFSNEMYKTIYCDHISSLFDTWLFKENLSRLNWEKFTDLMLSSAIVKLTSAKPFKAIRFHKNIFKKQTTADWLCIFLLTGLLYACYPVNSKKKENKLLFRGS